MCPNHQCTQISPVDRPKKAKSTPINRTLSQQARTMRYVRDKLPPPISYPKPDYTIDEEGRFIRASKYWFCQGMILSFSIEIFGSRNQGCHESLENYVACRQ